MKTERDVIPKPLQQGGQGQALYGLLQQLEQSQWWPAERMLAEQLQQLVRLLGYAASHSPFYRQHLDGVDPARLDAETLLDIPLLTRQQLQEENAQIDCVPIPEGHGGAEEARTSGSTGFPVCFRKTALTSTVWNAINMREQLWHARHYDGVSASIRWHGEAIGLAPDGLAFPDWGLPLNLFHTSGPSYFMNSSVDVAAQIRWLQRLRPRYLMTHPSNLRALLAQLIRDESVLLGLTQVRTIGESIDDDLRDAVRDQLGAELVDLYSSEELGYMALQCPQQDHYHVQSESVLLEVLRDDGSPCALHEPGRIVASSLRNYATPLIRYEIGDYGEWGEPCGCGRGLPVLKRIHGRVRNMLLHPDGSAHWPNFGFRKFMEVAAIRQFQLVQHALDRIEFRLVVDAPLSVEQEARLREILTQNLGHPFEIDISYHEALARSASGKFEDFLSRLTPAR